MKIDPTVEVIERDGSLDFGEWRFCYKTVHVYLFRHCSEKGSSYPVKSFPKRVWKAGSNTIGREVYMNIYNHHISSKMSKLIFWS